MLINDISTWWWRQIRSLLPEWCRRRLGTKLAAISAELDDNVLHLSYRKQSHTTKLFSYDLTESADSEQFARCQQAILPFLKRLRFQSISLIIRHEAVLERDVTLPLATERHLDTVIDYEMDRLTPFPADAVAKGHEILRRHPETQLLDIRLWVVPKILIARAVDIMAQLGVRPYLLLATDCSMAIPLANRTLAPGGMRRIRLAVVIASALCVAASISYGFWAQSVEQHRLYATIETLRPAAMHARTLQQAINEQVLGGGLVARERRRLGDPLAVLAAATRILPDDSYLTDFIMRQGEVIMTGRSPAATALIHALSQDSVFRNPVFIAPVTRVDGQNVSVFSLRATVGR